MTGVRRRARAAGTGPAILVLFALLALAGGAARPARAETLSEAYARALKDHYAGRYDRAIAAMERILAVPTEHPDLHYNLGAAYYRKGKLGPAIYHFERALMLDPGAEDARFNLRTAREQAAKNVTDELKGAAAPPLWHRVVTWLGPVTWAVAFLGAWWLTFVMLFVLRRTAEGPARSGLVAGTALVAVIALLCGLLLLGRAYHDRQVVQGIVLPDKLAVREGPGADTKATFHLHAGFKVRILGTRGEWVHLRLQNGLEGWAQTRDVGRL